MDPWLLRMGFVFPTWEPWENAWRNSSLNNKRSDGEDDGYMIGMMADLTGCSNRVLREMLTDSPEWMVKV